MNVFEKTRNMIRCWRMNHYGIMPNRIFLGHEEYDEAKTSYEFLNYANCENHAERMFGVIVERIDKKHYLAVGEVVEDLEVEKCEK